MVKIMRIIRTCLSAAIIILVLVTTANAADNKKIIYFIGCNDAEVVADIKYSIKGITSFAMQHQIVIGKPSTKGSKCGYLLIFNEKKKTLNAVQTDVDLIQIMKGFFNIRE
jgi:hypothetical protein